MRIVRLLVLLVLVGSIPVAASADSIAVGDVVRFSDGPGNTGGGEFILADVSDPADWIITFCLQKTEFMNFSSNFVVGGITPYTMPDGDPISSQTAWLYTQFTDQALANYVYGSVGNAVFANRQESANALQHAFWILEGEEAATPNYYVNLAMNNTPANFGTGDVAVLNMYAYSATAPGHLGASAQDQLTRSVPEPTTMALVGLGLVGLCVRRRQKA